MATLLTWFTILTLKKGTKDHWKYWGFARLKRNLTGDSSVCVALGLERHRPVKDQETTTTVTFCRSARPTFGNEIFLPYCFNGVDRLLSLCVLTAVVERLVVR